MHRRAPRAPSIGLAAFLAMAGCAAPYEYGVQLDIRSAPPPPRLVFYERPAYVARVSGVYVVDPGRSDCDMFQYGSYWYVYTGSYWYRARSYSGPYAVISFQSVPNRLYDVPERHWKNRHPHGGPPGQMKKRGRGVTS
jgi:hypothetical protein